MDVCYPMENLFEIANEKFLKKNQELLRTFDSLKSTKDLQKLIEKYIQRITWHIYRMYRTRNGIIHSGEIPRNIQHLGEHLHSYVDSTINEFIRKLSGDIPFNSVDDVITDVKFAVDNFDNMMQKKKSIDASIVNILIHPEIGYVMKCEEHIR